MRLFYEARDLVILGRIASQRPQEPSSKPWITLDAVKA
jgi:hypothetical protein